MVQLELEDRMTLSLFRLPRPASDGLRQWSFGLTLRLTESRTLSAPSPFVKVRNRAYAPRSKPSTLPTQMNLWPKHFATLTTDAMGKRQYNFQNGGLKADFAVSKIFARRSTLWCKRRAGRHDLQDTGRDIRFL